MSSFKANVHDRERQEQRILSLCAELQPALSLEWITVVHRFSEERDSEQATLCETEVEHKYHQATMKWHLVLASGATDESIWETAVHEYVHVMLGPIHDKLKAGEWAVADEEFATETVAVALLKLISRPFNADGSRLSIDPT